MGALNKWILGLVINTETQRRGFSDAGREPDRRQSARKESALTITVFFPLWHNSKEGTNWRDRFRKIK